MTHTSLEGAGLFRRDPRQRRIAFASMLALAMMVSALTIPIYGVLSQLIIDSLGISRYQFGWLVTAVTGTAALTSPLLGRMADHLGGREIVLATFIFGLISIVMIASAQTFRIMIVASLVAGVTNAAGNPGTNKLIATRIASGDRGLVMGVKQSGVQFGVLVGGLVLPALTVWFGWRLAVLTAAVIPMLGAVGATLILGRDTRPSDEEPSGGEFRRATTTGWIIGYSFVMGIGTAPVMSFLPLFAQEEVGMSVTSAGLAASGVGLSGVGARIAWGPLSESRQHFGEPMAALGLLSMMATAAIWAAAYRGTWLLWVGVLLAGASVAAWNVVANLAVVADISSRHAGRASGLMLGAFLIGMTTSPVAFGYSVDVSGSYDLGWSLVILAFGVATLVALLWRRFAQPD